MWEEPFLSLIHILAKRKIEAAYQAANRPIDNVKIMSTDIERIKGVITADDEVSRIYINFCNPWSKNGSSHKQMCIRDSPQAAGKIHSDFERGFIRASVIGLSLIHI